MNLFRWLVAVPLLGFGGYVAVLNGIVLVRLFRGRHTSWVPLLGGPAAAIGLLLVPVNGAAAWWWVPFVLDFGSAPFLGYTALWLLYTGLRRAVGFVLRRN